MNEAQRLTGFRYDANIGRQYLGPQTAKTKKEARDCWRHIQRYLRRHNGILSRVDIEWDIRERVYKSVLTWNTVIVTSQSIEPAQE